MGLFAGKSLVLLPVERARDERAARARLERAGSVRRGSATAEQSEYGRAAAGHRRMTRAGLAQRADDAANRRMPRGDGFLEVVDHVWSARLKGSRSFLLNGSRSRRAIPPGKRVLCAHTEIR